MLTFRLPKPPVEWVVLRPVRYSPGWLGRIAYLLGVCFVSLGMSIPTARAEPSIEFKSGPARVSLIELYTSEGCHSCPPADRWLSSRSEDKRLWKRLVPVAFHVDYWDYLGWKDRFASAAFSNRQRQYARIGAVRNVYTPGFIVDGREWRGWFRDPTLKLNPIAGASPGELSVRLKGQRVEAEFQTTSRPGQALLNIALLGSGLQTEVERGENAGKTLTHDFVVLGLRTVEFTSPVSDPKATAHWRAETSLPSSAIESPRYAFAAWVTDSPLGPPLQALGGWIEPH